MDREKRLINLYNGIYSHPGVVKALKVLGVTSTVLVALSFLYALAVLIFVGEFVSAVRLIALSGIPFTAITLMRRFINAKRPYEVIDCDAFSVMRETRKSGHSFPSRHVFSAFLIGVLWLIYSPYVGCAVLFLGVAMAVGRVLLGIHFFKDVLAGAVIGIVSGLIGMLIW